MALMQGLTSDKQWGQTLSLHKAQEFVLQQSLRAAVETVPLQQALHRVLAQDVLIPEDIPPFSVALTDGYAIRHKDACTDQIIPVVRTPAVDDTAIQLPMSSAAQIVKGARLPMGADTVISPEQCMYAGYQLRLHESVTAKSNIMTKAEFARQGHVIAQAGQGINNILLAILAELSLSQVAIHPTPSISVALFSSNPQEPLACHCWLTQATQGAHVDWHTWSSKHENNSDSLVTMVQQSTASLVVVAGDIPQLDWNHIQESLYGGLHEVVLADGQQLLLGKLADKLVLVLPVLKQELMILATWLIQPWIRQQLGRQTRLQKVTTSRKLDNSSPFDRLALAVSEFGGRGLRVKPCKDQAAGTAVQAVGANGIVLMPGKSEIGIGQKAEFLGFVG